MDNSKQKKRLDTQTILRMARRNTAYISNLLLNTMPYNNVFRIFSSFSR